MCLILTFGLVFNAVQANSIAAIAGAAWGIEGSWVGAILIVLTAPIIFGGVRAVARAAEVLAPAMALIYLAMTFFITAVHIAELPALSWLIVKSALGIEQAAGGLSGYAARMMQGIRRGLFSNEAGIGSAANAAASTRHPASQGMLQMVSVFLTTIVVCSATAFIILLSGVRQESGLDGIRLAQLAMASQFGGVG